MVCSLTFLISTVVRDRPRLPYPRPMPFNVFPVFLAWSLSDDPIATSVTASPPSVLDPATIALLERIGQQLNAISTTLSPYLGTVCIVVAWLTLFAIVSNAIVGITTAVRRLQTMHRIPCSRCAFFTNDYRLKCSVDPLSAGSEAAISCPHYEPCGTVYPSRLGSE